MLRGDALGRLFVALALEVGEQLVEPGLFGLAAARAVSRLGAVGAGDAGNETAGTGARPAKNAKRFRMAGNLVPGSGTSN